MLAFSKICFNYNLYGFCYCDKVKLNTLVFGEQLNWSLFDHTCN